MMTCLLIVDTATEACSCALVLDGNCTERYTVAPRRHTELILPMVDALLTDAGITTAQLDAIAFGAGPGSFTGVRIATALVQGIALAHDLPVIPLSCLAMLALSGARRHRVDTVLTLLDARMSQVYTAVYRVDETRAHAHCEAADSVCDIAKLTLPQSSDYIVVGNGARQYRRELAPRVGRQVLTDEPLYPRAADAATYVEQRFDDGAFTAPEFAEPVYLRRAL